MAAINTVFTIVTSHLLGEAEDWCLDLSIGVELEGGTLCVYGVGNDGVRAFDLLPESWTARCWKILVLTVLAGRRLGDEEVAVQ